MDEIADRFPQEGFEESIHFWVSIFAKYDENEVIFHDRHDVRLVYHVERFEKGIEGDASQRRLQQRRLKQVLAQVQSALRELAKGGPPRNALQTAILNRLREVGKKPGPKELRQLTQTVRMQRGIRSKFGAGLRRSGQYLEYTEAIFRDKNLPVELAMLPHVESSFYYGARSNVGAAGIWQLMRSSSRSLLTINFSVDERLDPLAATEAAASILQRNYALLGNWPLAITAYNHGVNGMRRARAKHGDDLSTIIQRYRSRLFGFASKNFYSEFLAAIFVVGNREQFFPGVDDDPGLSFDRIRLAQRYRVKDLAALQQLDLEELRKLNPQLRPSVWSSGILPSAINLKVPAGLGGAMKAELAQLQPVRVSAGVSVNRQGQLGYRVKRGDTLAKLARRFGVSEGTLQSANGIANKHRIYQGQFLLLPAGTDGTAATGGTTTYTVRKGDSLGKIASRFGTSVRRLQDLNKTGNRNRIYPGQKLVIRGATHYRVRWGDTLAQIAKRFRTSIGVLKAANGIGNANRIYRGQVLHIPAGH